MGNYYNYGSVYIQGAVGRPLIIIKQETILDMRDFQRHYSCVDISTLVNEAIRESLREKEESIRSLEIAGEQL